MPLENVVDGNGQRSDGRAEKRRGKARESSPLCWHYRSYARPSSLLARFVWFLSGQSSGRGIVVIDNFFHGASHFFFATGCDVAEEHHDDVDCTLVAIERLQSGLPEALANKLLKREPKLKC